MISIFEDYYRIVIGQLFDLFQPMRRVVYPFDDLIHLFQGRITFFACKESIRSPGSNCCSQIIYSKEYFKWWHETDQSWLMSRAIMTLGWNYDAEKSLLHVYKEIFRFQYTQNKDKMSIFQTVLVLINCFTCNAFQNLDDLEKFYKTDPVFDPFGASGWWTFD